VFFSTTIIGFPRRVNLWPRCLSNRYRKGEALLDGRALHCNPPTARLCNAFAEKVPNALQLALMRCKWGLPMRFSSLYN
jgi:hypothetical protein